MDKRKMPWHRHPIFLTLLAGLALLVLASAVYTVALRARQLSKAAQQAHGLNETLRVASAVRSDLLLANGYRIIDGAGFDASLALSQTLENADSGVASLESALADTDVKEFNTVVEPGNEFVAAVLAHIEATRNSPSGPETLATQARLDASFTEVFGALGTERQTMLERMESINETMNQVGSTAGYGVAFLVPAIALYVFEALRRTRLRARLGEQQAHTLERRLRSVATKDIQELDDLARQIRVLRNDPANAAPDIQVRLSGMAHRISTMNNRALSVGAMVTTQVVPMHVETLIRGATRASDITGVEVHTALQDQILHGDERHLHHILVELLRNAELHGGDDIRITAYQWDDSMTISVLDNGGGLNSEVEQALFAEDELELRHKLRDGDYGAGLLATRSRAEAMGAELSYDRTGGLTQFTVRFPVSSDGNPKSPKEPATV